MKVKDEREEILTDNERIVIHPGSTHDQRNRLRDVHSVDFDFFSLSLSHCASCVQFKLLGI